MLVTPPWPLLWARKPGGPSVTPPHRPIGTHLPSGAPWAGGPPLCHELWCVDCSQLSGIHGYNVGPPRGAVQ